jgi:hypothetical protein
VAGLHPLVWAEDATWSPERLTLAECLVGGDAGGGAIGLRAGLTVSHPSVGAGGCGLESWATVALVAIEVDSKK